MKIPSLFMGKIIVTLFPFIDIPSKNETFGSNTIRSATASWLGSIPLKSAENAVFLRFLQGGFNEPVDELSGFKRRGKIKLYQCRSYYADNAFEERKNRAKQLGEEAGTKLLLPMFLMLAVVLAVVIIPAFLSIQL